MLINAFPCFLSLFLICLVASCDDDDSFGELASQNDICLREGIDCPPGARCEQGDCICQNAEQEIGPGFCVDPLYGDINFVSYDTGPGCMDTVAIAFFDIDPFDTEWDWSGRDIIEMTTQTYNRKLVGQSGDSGVFILKRPDQAGVNVDSVIIANIPYSNDSFGYCPFPTDSTDVYCFKTFSGRFTDRNTIVGQACFWNCIDRKPRPPAALDCYPMTWHRLGS